jgi:hypothetical protein
MRLVAKSMLAVALTAGFVMSVSAQPPRGQGRGQQGGGFGFGGGGSVFGLVATNKALQEEIKLDEAGVTKVKEAIKPIQDKQREAGQGVNFREMTEEQRKEWTEKMAKFSEETKKAVEGAVSADQFKRLKQINVQNLRLRAFADKEVAAALKITDEQKEKVKAISDELQKDSRELMQSAFGGGGRPDPEKMAEFQKKTAALNKEAEEKVMGLMSDDQKKTYKELTGEKFDLAKLVPQFRPMKKDD